MRTFLPVAACAMLLLAHAKADEANLTGGISDVKDCMASENLGSLAGLRTYKRARTTEEKCFIGCIMKKIQVLNSDGQYDVALFKQHINRSPDLARKQQVKGTLLGVADDCAAKVGACSGHCECGILAGDCVSEGMEAKGQETIYDVLDKIIEKMDA